MYFAYDIKNARGLQYKGCEKLIHTDNKPNKPYKDKYMVLVKMKMLFFFFLLLQ